MPDLVDSSSPFSPYRSDGKLYGFVCVVTGTTQPIGQAIVRELAGEKQLKYLELHQLM